MKTKQNRRRRRRKRPGKVKQAVWDDRASGHGLLINALNEQILRISAFTYLKNVTYLQEQQWPLLRLWDREGARKDFRNSGAFIIYFTKLSGFIPMYAFRRRCPCR